MATKTKTKKNVSGKHNISEKPILSEKASALLPPALIIIFTVFYFLFIGHPIFFYQENISLFIYSGDYFHKFALKPGGLLEYTGYFLTQFYFSPFLGTAIITTIFLLIWFVFRKISEKLAYGGALNGFLILIPSWLLLLVQMRYDHFMHISLGFLAVVSYFLLSISLKGRNQKLLMILLFPVFFYLTGSFASLFAIMFIIYCIVYERTTDRIILPSFLIVIYTLSFFLFRDLLFYHPSEAFFSYPLPVNRLTNVSTFLLILSVCSVLFPAILKLGTAITIRHDKKAIIFPVSILTGFLLTGIIMLFLHDSDLTLLMKLEQKVFKQDWDGVIIQQEKEPSTNIIGQYYYNLALSEKGILCDRLLIGRQDFGSKSLCLPRDNEHYNRVVYFYYTVGLINEARHLAYESMVGYGYRPESIKLLIKTELINGNYRVAEKYINVLKKTLHYRTLALRYEKMLNNPVLVKSDPELGEKMGLVPEIDFFVRSDNRENINLLWLANKNNTKAFEYRIAWMLLDKDLKSAVNEIKNMKDMGYRRIPRYLQEAVIGYINRSGTLPDLGGLLLDPDTELRFNQYGMVYVRYEKNRITLEKELRKAGGNTLWYYVEFK
jgi:hypothetical protein